MLHKPNNVVLLSRDFPLEQIGPKPYKALMFLAYHADPATGVVWKTIDDLRYEVKATRAEVHKLLSELEEDGFLKCDGDTITFLDNEYIKIPKDQTPPAK